MLPTFTREIKWCVPFRTAWIFKKKVLFKWDRESKGVIVGCKRRIAIALYRIAVKPVMPLVLPQDDVC